MCAIWGISLLNGSVLKDATTFKRLIRTLSLAGESRGRDASGLAIGSEREIVVVKKAVGAFTFASSDYLNSALAKYADIYANKDGGPISVIGHNRFKTKGSPSNNDNNHPIVADEITGVHNGMITNDDELFSKYGFYRKAEVDSEILFRMLDTFVNKQNLTYTKALEMINSTVNGSYAIAALNRRDPYKLVLAKNSSPLHYRLYPNFGIFMFASTEHMLNKAVEQLKLGESYKGEVKGDSALLLDLYYNKYKKIDLLKKNFVEAYA